MVQRPQHRSPALSVPPPDATDSLQLGPQDAADHAEKKLVVRDDAQRPQVYRAAAPRGDTERHFIKDLTARLFGGSAAALVLRALSTHRPSREELAALRKRLDQLDERGHDD